MREFRRIERLIRRLELEGYEGNLLLDYLTMRSEQFEHIDHHLNTIERKIDSLVESKCKFSSTNSNVTELLIGDKDGTKKRKSEKKYLKKWISKCSDNLVIADPYFFSFSGPNKIFKNVKEYTEFVCDLIPIDISSLEVFHLPGPNNQVKLKIDRVLRSRNIKLRYTETNEIHDRVFIRDQFEAILVGTSLGGYGNKLAFVLDLPDVDLELFKVELERIRVA